MQTIYSFHVTVSAVEPKTGNKPLLCLSVGGTENGVSGFDLEIPGDWYDQAAIALLAAKPNIAGDPEGTWQIKPSYEGAVGRLEFTRTCVGLQKQAWNASLHIPLAAPGSKTRVEGLKFGVDGKESVALDPVDLPKAESFALVRLHSKNETSTVALPFGHQVDLECILEGDVAEEAELHGSLDGASLRTVKNKDIIRVHVIDDRTYELRARRKSRPEILRSSIKVAIDKEDSAIQVKTFPGAVLPGGPFTLIYHAVEVTDVSFDVTGNGKDSEFILPDLTNRAINKGATLDLKGSFAVRNGPMEDSEYRVVISYHNKESAKTETKIKHSVVVTKVSTKAPKEKISSIGTPRAMVAGRYKARQSHEIPPHTPDGDRIVTWFAVATGTGLRIGFVWVHGDQTVLRTRDSIDASSEIRAVALLEKTPHSRCVVYLVHENGKNVLKMIEDISRRSSPVVLDRIKLPHGHEVQPNLRLLSLGSRLYIQSLGNAHSIDLATDTPVWVAEPALAHIPPAFEMAAVTAQSGTGGNIYTLDKATGLFLRYDLEPGAALRNEPLAGPFALAPANAWLAKPERLYLAQSGSGADLDDKKQFRRPAPGDVKTKNDTHLEWDAGCVDEKARMLAVNGAIVVRCERTDFTRKNIRQDRVYDPALNIWVRCGHCFPEAPADALLAATHTRLGSVKDAAMVCVERTGAVWTLTGPLTHYLGLLDYNLAPNPLLAAQTKPVPWRSYILRAGEELAPGQYLQSPNGKYMLVHEPVGQLTLYEMGDRKPVGDNTKGHWTIDRKTLWEAKYVLKKGEVAIASNNQSIPLHATVKLLRTGNLVITHGSGDDAPVYETQKAGGACCDPARPETRTFVETRAALLNISCGSAEDECANSRLVCEDDGSLVIYSSSNIPLWHRPVCLPKLESGRLLFPGDSVGDLTSVNLKYELDGRLLLGPANTVTWATPPLSGPNMVVMQATGALDIFGQKIREPIWSSHRRGSLAAEGAPRLRVGTTGDKPVAEVISGDRTLWSTQNRVTDMGPDRKLSAGQYWESPNGQCALVMGWHGALVLWQAGEPVWWSAGTMSKSAVSTPPTYGRRAVVASLEPYARLSERGVLEIQSGRGPDGLTSFPNERAAPYEDRGAVLELNDHGFSVYSKGGSASGVAWYSVTDRGGTFPAPGQVRAENTLRCRLYNPADDMNGYMFAHGDWREAGGDKVAFRKNGGREYSDSIWIIEEILPGRYTIFNENRRRYMYASDKFLTTGLLSSKDFTRRHVFYGPAEWLFKDREQTAGFFEFESPPDFGHKFSFRSAKFGQYVYPSSYESNGDTWRVMMWAPGGTVNGCDWRIEEV